MKSVTVVLSLLGAAALVSATAGVAEGDKLAIRHGSRTRRHAKRHRRHRRATTHHCQDADDATASVASKPSYGNSASASGSGAAASASASSVKSASSNGTITSSGFGGNYPSLSVKVNGVHFGMLPDGGTDGGSKDSMASLNKLISNTGGVHATYGQYAQARSGTPFDGSQLLQVLDDLKKSGAIFEPAVMPTGGWQGLKYSDNSQAVAICKVMKKFNDEGVEVRLRFAHEANYYQTDGTYEGTAADFKEGWAVVAAACKQYAPDTKMFWTPNVASLAEYERYAPDDMSTVHYVGIDYYPSASSSLSTAFVTAMQGFHDKWASESTLFAIGETGLGYAGSADEKLTWIKSIAAAKSGAMPHITSVAWFNYQKGYNFKICDPNDSATTGHYVNFLQSS